MRLGKVIHGRDVFWSVQELAAHLNLPSANIRRQMEIGNLRGTRFNGRALRVAPGAVVAWLRGCSTTGSKEGETMKEPDPLPLPESEFLTVARLARIIGCGKDLVYRALYDGQLHGCRFGRRGWRISPSAARDWIESRPRA